jgi:hypothetical protein
VEAVSSEREKALEEFVQRLVPPEQPSDDGAQELARR